MRQRLLLGRSSVACTWKAFSKGLSSSTGSATTSKLLHRIRAAVEVEIQPHIEEVLMIRRIEPRRDHRSVLRLFAIAGPRPAKECPSA